MSYTTKLNDYCFETAETVGAHIDPDAETKDAPQTKVVKATSKGVKTK